MKRKESTEKLSVEKNENQQDDLLCDGQIKPADHMDTFLEVTHHIQGKHRPGNFRKETSIIVVDTI